VGFFQIRSTYQATGCSDIRPERGLRGGCHQNPTAGQDLCVFSVPYAPEDVRNDGCHLYKIDIPSGLKQDLGGVVERAQGPCYWFFIDQKGDCWFSLWRGHGRYPECGRGNLYRVLANSGRIECFEDVLPDCKLAPDGKPVAEDQLIDRRWTWAEALPGEKALPFHDGISRGRG
jgi:hypothetical protein